MASVLTPPIAIHLAAALPALAIGIAVLVRAKGTPSHKALGRLWAALLAVAALSSFWIFELRAGAFSWIHALSVWTLFSLASAIVAIRRGRVRAHRRFMLGSFAGLAAAGAAALAPGRFLAQLLG